MNRPKVEEFEFLEEYAETLEIYCDQLEKALDKACEELEKCEKDFDKIYGTSYAKIENKKYWKKELMEDD